jgi:6-phosphogluconolactonase
VILHRFNALETAAAALAAQVAAGLREALLARGQASLVVPGGRTPSALFRALRRWEMDWSRVQVTLSDERWVTETHEASNAALVRRELLSGPASAARLQPLYNGAPSAVAGAALSWQSLAGMPRPFDVVVLGMGEDGHFASLFPGSPGLAAALDASAPAGCVAMRAPVTPTDRLSLNLAALANARRLFLLVSGEGKRVLLESAVQSPPETSLPISALLAVREPAPEVYWAP